VRVACAYDHAGVPLREPVEKAILEAGHELVELGVAEDYPDVALEIGQAVISGRAQRGILVCGSGAGVAVAASKLPGIRAAVAHDSYTAAQCVSHDDCNVLCLGARVLGPELAADLVRIYVQATFSGAERHVRRLAKIAAIERDGEAAKLEGITG
jgi:ribose 5-phosphate isomerase B